MGSDFIVQHPSGPWFQLSVTEWAKAVAVYPELLNIGEVNYLDRTASAYIPLNGDSYFDSETILNQFERLFKMIQFKEDFLAYDIEILVDNATTHTAMPYTLSQFPKGVFILFIFEIGIKISS